MVCRVAPSAETGVDQPPETMIFRYLRDAIARNRIPIGTQIRVSGVAEDRGSSPETVARAVLLLAEEGLVERGDRDRAIVLPISEQRLRDAVFLREQAEVEIIRRVTEEADTGFLNELREQILRQKLVGMRGPRDLLRLDNRFHRTLAAQAGVDSIWPCLEIWKLCIDRVRFTVDESQTPEEMISQHTALVDRIAMRDVEGAAAAIRYHVSSVLRRLPEYRRAHPERFRD